MSNEINEGVPILERLGQEKVAELLQRVAEQADEGEWR